MRVANVTRRGPLYFGGNFANFDFCLERIAVRSRTSNFVFILLNQFIKRTILPFNRLLRIANVASQRVANTSERRFLILIAGNDRQKR